MRYKIITYVPVEHAEVVRKAMGEAGAGKIGNYSFCSFSVRGTGRFLPGADAKPFVGAVGKLEEVEEEKIEMICDKELAPAVITALKKSHPYEEVAYEVFEMVEL